MQPASEEDQAQVPWYIAPEGETAGAAHTRPGWARRHTWNSAADHAGTSEARWADSGPGAALPEPGCAVPSLPCMFTVPLDCLEFYIPALMLSTEAVGQT